jgi:hypothetical protein
MATSLRDNFRLTFQDFCGQVRRDLASEISRLRRPPNSNTREQVHSNFRNPALSEEITIISKAETSGLHLVDLMIPIRNAKLYRTTVKLTFSFLKISFSHPRIPRRRDRRYGMRQDKIS